MSSESSMHRVLKDIATEILREKGYDEVREEETVRVENRFYKVDVVACKGENKLAVECGQTEASKLEQLASVFDEVLHVTPVVAIEFLQNKLKKCEVELAKCRAEIEHLKSKQTLNLETLQEGDWVWVKVPLKYLHYVKKMISVFLWTGQKKPLEKP